MQRGGGKMKIKLFLRVIMGPGGEFTEEMDFDPDNIDGMDEEEIEDYLQDFANVWVQNNISAGATLEEEK